jgi:hypothetical protein
LPLHFAIAAATEKRRRTHSRGNTVGRSSASDNKLNPQQSIEGEAKTNRYFNGQFSIDSIN